MVVKKQVLVVKVDVDSLPVGFGSTSATLKGSISLRSCSKWTQQEPLERLESALSYDYSWSSIGLVIWEICLKQVNCSVLDRVQIVWED